ncbi:MAG: hypothetical protein Q4C68_08780, partial [Moraxella sp.]|nr:hypothetical protein [Moraxella sp.]
DPLEQLYKQSKLIEIDQSMSNKLTPPPLPTWQTLHADGLDELVDVIQATLPFLNQSATPQQIDANAHLILSGLGNDLQKSLGGKWRDFFYSAQHHQNGRIDLLFDELLCQTVIASLKTEQQQTHGLTLASLYKKRLLALDKWNKNHIKPAIEHSKSLI